MVGTDFSAVLAIDIEQEIEMLPSAVTDALPIPYSHWYAACLLLETGYPTEQVLARIGQDEAHWHACNARYQQLHFVNMPWVKGIFERDGLPAPEVSLELYEHLIKGSQYRPLIEEPFTLHNQLTAIRRQVEVDPQFEPFSDIGWFANYICARSFPPIRYLHNNLQVFANGSPLCDRKGRTLENIDPFTFRKLGERWFRDKNRIYGQGKTATKRFWFVAKSADPESFVVLNERYAADKNAGYYITNLRLPTVEAGTFEIVGYPYGHGQKPGFHIEESHYAKDSQKVYAYGVTIKGAHAPSFTAIGDEGRYFADKHSIYWDKFPILSADVDSFRCASLVGQYRAYDKNGPFYAGKPQSITEEFDDWREYFEARPHIEQNWWHIENSRRA